MSESRAGAGEAGPSGWWYGLAALVASATVVVTGIAGYGRATDLIDQVDGFQHFSGSGSTSVWVEERGEYAVYHEWVERGGGNPYATGTPAAEPVIRVTAPDGADVPVHPSNVSYGWGREQAEAVGTFDITQPGEYRIEATGTEGHLAFGKRIPGSPLYGFGGTLLVAATIVVACAVGSLVVAKRRRDWRRGPIDRGPTGADSGSGRTRAVVAVGLVVVVVAGGAVALAGRDGDESPDAVQMERSSGGDAREPGTTIECRSDEDFETGLCGVDPEVLRESNLAYADRLAFSGDRAAANLIAQRARTALAPLADVRPHPSPEQVDEALAPVSTDVVVSDNAVRTAGAAFGIAVDGGCVFGSVHDGSVEVEIGGYVNDGGCLAEYAH